MLFQYPDVLDELNRAMATAHAEIAPAFAHLKIFLGLLQAASPHEFIPVFLSLLPLLGISEIRKG
jgi:hypothetical protein